MRTILPKIIIFLLIFSNAYSYAQVNIHSTCMKHVKKISSQLDIPFEILGAVALTETGIQKNKFLQPWPWAVNAHGKGYIFDSKKEAILFTKQYLSSGKTSIDLGCMQMNWRWHKQRFKKSVTKMFNPQNNIYQAALFLKEQYQHTHDWVKAIGRYHSKNQKYAQQYIKKAMLNLKLLGQQSTHNIFENSIQPARKQPQSNTIIYKQILPPKPQIMLEFKHSGAFIEFNKAPSPLIQLPQKPVYLIP